MKRRSFIIQSAAGVVSLSTAFSFRAAYQSRQKLGVALVGLGYYSTDLLAPALQLTEHCYLAGVVSGVPSKASAWASRYKFPDKNIYNYDNFDSIVKNDDIDIVYVVLPPSMHAEYSIRAANAGKHVWCEKPMAVTTGECQKMIDACAKNKVKLSIGYRVQHEPNTQKLIQLRKELKYGKPVKVTAAAGYFDSRTDHWKQKKKMGGGSMYDMGVYPLNAARYSTGLEPIAVTAKRSTTRPAIYKEVDETMNFDLEFPDGAAASCETSFGKGMNDLLANYEKGWVKLSPFQSYSGISGITSDGISLDAKIRNQQAKQMDDDAIAIKNNTSVLVPGEEGLRDIRVVEAVYRSVAENRRVTV